MLAAAVLPVFFSPALPHCPAACVLLPSQLTLLIKDKGTLGEDKLEELKEVVGEEDKAKEIIEVRAAGRGGRLCASSSVVHCGGVCFGGITRAVPLQQASWLPPPHTL